MIQDVAIEELPKFENRDMISKVSTLTSYQVPAKEKKFHVVALDFGIKTNLIRMMNERGCDVTVVPANTTSQEILDHKPDGVFLSNGPGDPSAAPYAVATVSALLGKVPIFGVCMGHQILSLALGAKTFKLKFGHRGGNQPVKDRLTGRVEISSHNHGYAVDPSTLPTSVQITHINLNDECVEGISAPDKDAYSVQFHPEACPGPHDSISLFNKFIQSMKNRL